MILVEAIRRLDIAVLMRYHQTSDASGMMHGFTRASPWHPVMVLE
jgi:hypothetical protein